MKKLLAALLCWMLFMAQAAAMVRGETETGLNYELEYPVVTVTDMQASARINADIEKYTAAFKRDFSRGRFMSGATRYDVRYEDDKLLSLTLTDYRYMMGAAHGSYTVYGLVYDKATGRRIPLKKQVALKKEDLQQLVYRSLQSLDGSAVEFNADFYNVDRVPQDYYVDASGNVYVLFQPYELACYAAGATAIKLDAAEQDYFNRKNG